MFSFLSLGLQENLLVDPNHVLLSGNNLGVLKILQKDLDWNMSSILLLLLLIRQLYNTYCPCPPAYHRTVFCCKYRFCFTKSQIFNPIAPPGWKYIMHFLMRGMCTKWLYRFTVYVMIWCYEYFISPPPSPL